MTAQSWIGKTINDRYRIETLLGQGGMSAVYQAIDPNLRRPVAIKLIHPHLSTNPNFIHRFKEEAAAVARLRHPNIVQVYDFDADGDTYYMVMEYLIGETLQARLKRNNSAGRLLPYWDVTRIGLQLCDAVAYAHNHDLVHRDIKPANIMLDVNNQAILLDFGIVKIIGGEYHTATGATIGTAMYMSPEQIRSERIDDRSDIYSLGVTLYEMISGLPPYQADSTPSLMMMVLNDPLPDLAKIRPGIPKDLLVTVEKAMARDQEERFQSADELAERLKQVQDQLGEYKPVTTILDDSQGKQVLSKAPAPTGEPTLKDTSPDALLGEAHRLKQPDQMVTPDTTEKDPPEKPKTTPEYAAETSLQGWKRLFSRRNVISTAGILLVLLLIAGGFLLYDSRKAPILNLAPITNPAAPVNAQNAQAVVSLGRWETNSFISALAISPDGDWLATGNNRDLNPFTHYRFYSGLWSLKTASLQTYLTGHNDWVTSVAFSPNGTLLATASSDDTLFLWKGSTGERVREIEASSGGILKVTFSHNNMLIASCSWDGLVRLWQVSNGNLLRTMQADDHTIYDVEFSPDDRLLASASSSNDILLWGVSDGMLFDTLQGHTFPVRAVAFSPDGTLLASASEDATIKLWQVKDGSLLRTINGHEDTIHDVVFSSDGSVLASASEDGVLILWQVSNGQPLNSLTEEADSIYSLTFTSDSRYLISGGADGLVTFWGISEAIPLEPSSENP